MNAGDIVKMLEHYFVTELTDEDRLRIYDAIHGSPAQNRPELNLTPAQVEQMAAEHDDLHGMIHAVEMKGMPKPTMDQRTSSQSRVAFGV